VTEGVSKTSLITFTHLSVITDVGSLTFTTLDLQKEIMKRTFTHNRP